MTTPQEIIKEFAKIVIETRIVQDSNFATKSGKDLEDFLISTVIKQYEDMLGEIDSMKKPELTKPAREGIIGAMAINFQYNEALSDLRLSLQSKIKEWKLIYEK